MLEKLQIVKNRFDEVSDLIIQPDIISDQKQYVQLNKEYKDLNALMKMGNLISTQRFRKGSLWLVFCLHRPQPFQ